MTVTAAVPSVADLIAEATVAATPVASAALVPVDEVDRVAGTLGRAVGHLLSLQDDAGWWKGDLETNTTMDSEDLMLRHWLGIWDPKQAELTARFIRPQQNPDGSWPIYHGGPGDLAATVESYIALRMVGDSPDAPHMRAAAAWARARGGVPATRVFTRIWLALFGWWRWEDLPVLPPELMFVPAKMPLSIYRFASWGRQTIVAIMVLMAHRPTGIPPFSIQELFPEPEAPAGRRRGRRPAATDPRDVLLEDLFAGSAPAGAAAPGGALVPAAPAPAPPPPGPKAASH
ncbi:hypothetical protein I7412_13275 [Frankia sp. CN6]|uniref:Squalene cyclase N-terminal domain-containing protein n=1 Tax=Frankia nepalensis TaxID=1836974 RepID=A0A937RFU9_9ACTN|nr:hypothetical protein [Frankia nepalensis]